MYQNQEQTHPLPRLAHSQNTSDNDEILSIAEQLLTAAKTLGSRPQDRSILRQHPLKGFPQLTFAQGLLRLHTLGGGRVWPSTGHEQPLTDNRLRAMRKLSRCCLTYVQKGQTEGLDLWDFFLQRWVLRDDIMHQLQFLSAADLESPWASLEKLSLKHSSLETRSAFFTELLWTLPGWASYWADLANSDKGARDLCAFAVIACFYTAKTRPKTTQNAKLSDQFEIQMQRLETAEARFRQEIFGSLPREVVRSSSRARWQALFCIDPRCEPVRTQWEQLEPDLDTFSCSGAFALPPQQSPQAISPATVEKLADLLRSIDLTENFARLVLVVGHTQTEPDSWHSGFLECTACGGHSGAEHARFTARALNQPQVRVALVRCGIIIPEDTVFVAAVLHTLPRTIELLDANHIPPTHARDGEELKTSLETLASLQDRLKSASPSPWQRLSGGAAGNAALIIAPRDHSRALDLKGRCFLHSYRWQADDESAQCLSGILRGPLAVAMEINLQFYFSSVDPNFWGAGQAQESHLLDQGLRLRSHDRDLIRSLPKEALETFEGQAHEPLRLQVLIAAPAEYVLHALEQAPLVHEAWKKDWFTVTLWNKDGSFSAFPYRS